MRSRAYSKFEEVTPSGFFGFECSAEWKTQSWKTLESGQTSSAPDKTLRLSIYKFSILGVVQNGKLGVEKPQNYIL